MVAISSSQNHGGADLVFSNVVNIINQVDLVFIHCNNISTFKPEKKIIKHFFFNLNRTSKSIIKYFFYYFWVENIFFYKQVKKNEVVYVNDFVPLLSLCFCKIFKRIKITLHCHSAFKENIKNRFITGPFIDIMTEQIIAPSLFLKINLSKLSIEEDKISIIHNGIKPLPRIKVPKCSNLTIGLFGAIAPLKGQKVLFNTASVMKKKGINFSFLYAGQILDSTYHKSLLDTYKILISTQYVRYLGDLDRENLAKSMAECDIVLCISVEADVLPTVLLEAMSIGKCVIGTEIGGIPEIINSSNGILIPPNDVNALVEAIERLNNSPTLMNEFSIKALATYDELFSWERFAKEIDKYFGVKADLLLSQ